MDPTTPRNPAALDFLLTRRSRPFKSLEPPVPGRAELEEILTAAARVPDHGKLEPFRFIVLEPAALARLADAARAHGSVAGHDAEAIEKMRFQFATGPMAVAVVSAPQASEKIPAREQTFAAGAACLSLLNAALAAGWGANWLTGWAAHDAEFCRAHLGLLDTEALVGFVHIGTARAAPPERPRPDIAAITTWVAE